ncbi:unnamed protein product [Callosobruchus maculatus]|uniref:Uncharacterized protein n=1 Tax=Callosobruchus maculatus TaxID=64391 RepID=A0A653CYT8_CALMS|nr:unnamed protein product [Callosobruchus maculatus]
MFNVSFSEMFTYFPAFLPTKPIWWKFSKRMSTHDCSAASNVSSNSLSENVQTKDTTELTRQKPEVNKEPNDCIINEPSASIFSGSPLDATIIDRMASQDITPREDSKNGVLKNTFNIRKKRRTSLPIIANAGQDAFQKQKKSNPRKTRRNRILNNTLLDPNNFQPTHKTVDKTSVFEEIEESRPRTISNGDINESPIEHGLYQTSWQTVSDFEVSENIMPRKPKRTRSTSESLLGTFVDHKLSKKAKKSSHGRRKSIGMLNAPLTTDLTSQLNVADTFSDISSQALPQKLEVSTNKRTRSTSESLLGLFIDHKLSEKSKKSNDTKTRSIRKVNGILSTGLTAQIKKPKTSSLRRSKSIGMLNGTLITDFFPQLNAGPVVKKPKLATPQRKRNNGIINGSLVKIKEAERVTPRKTKSTVRLNGSLTADLCSPQSTLPLDPGDIEKANGILSDEISHSTLQSIAQNLSKMQKSRVCGPTRTRSQSVGPKRTRSQSVSNGSLSDIEISQSTLRKTAQEAKVLTSRKTKSNGKLNGTLTNLYPPQATLLLEHQVPVDQEPKDSTVILTESLQEPAQESLIQDTEEPTPKRTRKNGKVNGVLSDDLSSKSSHFTANLSINEDTEKRTPKRNRKNGKINGVVSDDLASKSSPQCIDNSLIIEDTKKPTPKRTRKNGKVNDTLSDDLSIKSSPQCIPNSPIIEETEEPRAKRTRRNGKVNGMLSDDLSSKSSPQCIANSPIIEEPRAGPPIKNSRNRLRRRKSQRISMQVTVVQEPKKMENPCSQLTTGKPVIKLERLTFDASGAVTWPSTLKGRRVDMQQALEDLERFEEDLQREKQRKFRKPLNGKETYSREYVVERILDQEFDVETKSLMFQVKWEGYPLEHSTWEPLHHLQHCDLLLTQFLAERLSAQVLESLCEKLNISSRLSDQELLEVLKLTDLRGLPDKIELQEKLMRLVATPPKERHVRRLEVGKRAMLMYQLVLRREQQLKKLKAWEDSINEMTKEEALITIENYVDLECPPEGFTYIHENIPTNGIVVQSDPDRFCECEECGPRQDCCGKQPHNGYTYRPSNKININPGNAVYECNKKCKCSQDCRNRVVQNGRKVPLCIFRTSNGCGWGVKATRKIHCGEFVCEYVGEIITHEEAEERGRAYDQEGRTYLFDLDYNSKDNPYTVDAAKFGNISHFINHSCDPNLGVYAVWIDCSDPNLPRLALFALREIQRDEEITFDYMMNIDPEMPTTPEKSRFLHTPDKNEVIQNGKNICKCEADACRRYLF